MRLRHLAAPCALLVLTALGCGGSPRHTQAVHPKIAPPPAAAAAKPPRLSGPPGLPAHVIATMDDQESTPYFARRGEEGLVLYASRGRWMTRVVGADGAPKREAPIDAAPLAAAVSVGALRAVGDGYVATWVELAGNAKNHAVKIMALDASGKPTSGPTLVTQSAEELSWVDVLPNEKGALLVWELPRDQRSDLMVAPIKGGNVAGPPVVVVRDALGWEAFATSRGAVITMIQAAAPGPEAAAAAKLGRVELVEVDATGKPGPAIVVSAEPTAQIDPEVVEIGGRYVVAWTDERDIDASVYLATVEPGGKLASAPHRATSPLGEQALVALVARPAASGGGGRALLAWEDLLRSSPGGRQIHLGPVLPDGSVGRERATMSFSASGPPDVVADGDGFAAVTLAPSSTAESPPTRDTPVLPAFVRFGPDLTVRAAEPVRADAFMDTDGAPYLTRGLACEQGTCTTFATGAAGSPALALVSLPVRESPWRAPAWRDADDTSPRATRVAALYDGDHLADVAATSTASGVLAGWVTYYLGGATEAPIAPGKGKKAPTREERGDEATFGVRPISSAGVPGKPIVLSRHAISMGGLAMATAPGPKSETAIAWVGRERGEPQVFVTKVGPDGEKLAQKGVTVLPRRPKKQGGPPSEASDVAIAYSGGGDGNEGWTVAWVDTRDGNAEIYVAKLDRELKKIVPDRRITDAPGDSAEVSIVVRGKDTFLAWSDARNNPEEGNADIFLARLESRSLRKLEPETRLFASTTHSRSPVLATTSGGLGLAWLEEGPADVANKPGKRPDGAATTSASAEAGVRLAWIDAEGRLVGAPSRVRSEAQGAVTSVALTCEQTCRGVLTAGARGTLTMSAFETKPGGEPSLLKPIAALTGGVTEDVSPAFAGPKADSLFFADDAIGGTGRVRWMMLAW